MKKIFALLMFVFVMAMPVCFAEQTADEETPTARLMSYNRRAVLLAREDTKEWIVIQAKGYQGLFADDDRIIGKFDDWGRTQIFTDETSGGKFSGKIFLTTLDADKAFNTFDMISSGTLKLP